MVAGSWFAPPRSFTKLIHYALRETLSVFTTRLSNNQMIVLYIYIFFGKRKRSVRGLSFRASLPACFPSAPLGTALDCVVPESLVSAREPRSRRARRPRGEGVAIESHAQSAACAGVEYPSAQRPRPFDSAQGPRGSYLARVILPSRLNVAGGYYLRAFVKATL